MAGAVSRRITLRVASALTCRGGGLSGWFWFRPSYLPCCPLRVVRPEGRETRVPGQYFR